MAYSSSETTTGEKSAPQMPLFSCKLVFTRLIQRLIPELTPEQIKMFASIKFPCC